jgi:hypothetical protein
VTLRLPAKRIIFLTLVRSLLLFAAVCVVTPKSSATPQQQAEGWAGIKTNEGLLFVWNVKDVHFTLSIKGKEIKSLNDPDHIFFSVDGMVFQVQMAAINEFASDVREKQLNDRAILAAHREWETKFLEDLLKSKLAVRNFNVRLSNGADASLWQYDMPAEANTESTKQVYLTAVNQNYVLLLNVAVTSTVTDEVARKYLLETMATLKRSPETIDVQKLAESIRTGARP